MPKIGAPKEEADLLFTLVCMKCKCPLEKLVDRFNLYGGAARHVYYCTHRHDCGEPERQGCIPQRVYTVTVTADTSKAKQQLEELKAAANLMAERGPWEGA